MDSKQQHYVPRFLLKNFTTGKKPYIWVFDKHKEVSFRTNIKNIAAEKGFYNFETADSTLTLEPGLAHLEDRTSSILSELLKSKKLSILKEDSRVVLSFFMAVQFVRTKEHRLILKSLSDALINKLKQMGASDEEVSRFIASEDDDKISSLKLILDAKKFAPHFLNKTWMLFETSISAPLYISDNPMTLDNQLDHSPYGNLGLAVRGIEIYLPLSTTICLGFICPSIGEEVVKAEQNFRILDQMDPGTAEGLLKDPVGTREYCKRVVNGTPIALKHENVMRLNSLQVRFSSRFVYCETDDFDLVRTMIKDNPKSREELKPTFN